MAKGEFRWREHSPLSSSPKCRRVYEPRKAPVCGVCSGRGTIGLATCDNCKGTGQPYYVVEKRAKPIVVVAE
jgi:hypothetical protein